MGIQHPVFIRPVDKDKLMVLTIINRDVLPQIKTDSFIIATTDTSPLSLGNTTITLIEETLITSDRYADVVNKADNSRGVENTIGMGVDGVLRGAYWFNKRVMTFADFYK